MSKKSKPRETLEEKYRRLKQQEAKPMTAKLRAKLQFGRTAKSRKRR